MKFNNLKQKVVMKFDNLKQKVVSFFAKPSVTTDAVAIDTRRLTTAGLTTLVVGAVVASGAAVAIVAPVVGSFAYDIYDVGVNDILKGPIGFVGGMLGIIFGATQIVKSWMVGILCILAGTVAIKADSITASLGMLL